MDPGLVLDPMRIHKESEFNLFLEVGSGSGPRPDRMGNNGLVAAHEIMETVGISSSREIITDQ